jgi:hypothetical protein
MSSPRCSSGFVSDASQLSGCSVLLYGLLSTLDNVADIVVSRFANLNLRALRARTESRGIVCLLAEGIGVTERVCT